MMRTALLGMVLALGVGTSVVACSDDDTPATPTTPGADAGPGDPGPTPGSDAGPGGSDGSSPSPDGSTTPATATQDRVYASSAFGLGYVPLGGGDGVKIGDPQNGLAVILAPDRKRVAATNGFASTTSDVYGRDDKKIVTITGNVIAWLDNDTLLVGTAGGIGNQQFSDLRRIKFDGTGDTKIFTATTGVTFRANEHSVSKDGKMIAVATTDNKVKVLSLANGSEMGSKDQTASTIPFFSKDGNVLWAASGAATSYFIAPPTLASPKTVDAGGQLASGNGSGPFNEWVGNDVLVGIEKKGDGGLRISTINVAKTDGSKPVEIPGIAALGNVLVERIHVSLDGKKFIYNIGASLSIANVDGSGNMLIKNLGADPQVCAW